MKKIEWKLYNLNPILFTFSINSTQMHFNPLKYHWATQTKLEKLEKTPQRTRVCVLLLVVFPSNLPPGGDKFLTGWHSDILVIASAAHTHSLQPPDIHTNTWRNIQSLTPLRSFICAPVSGRGVEWQYGIPRGTERCGDRHPNPLSQQTPKHRKTRPKRGKKNYKPEDQGPSQPLLLC